MGIKLKMSLCLSPTSYRVFRESLYRRYILASLQHAEIGNSVIFLSGLVARIYDSCLLLTQWFLCKVMCQKEKKM
jgi:hypothetical protein